MALIPTEFSADDNRVLQPEHKPFICRPIKNTGDTSALLIHGFTGTPREMIPLAKHLAAKGITSVAVRLPGHGTTPEDLTHKSFEEWVETVTHGHHFLKKESRQVVAVGLSTGALVALAAHASDNFAGLILLSPYLRVKHPLAPLAGLLRYFIRYQHREIKREEQPHYYSKRPMEGVHQINRLIKKIKGELESVRAPTVVACAEGDQTVDPQSAIELFHLLGSQNKRLYRYGPEVPHVMTTAENPKQKEILTLVSNFIETINA
jgi:carboxylesterase